MNIIGHFLRRIVNEAVDQAIRTLSRDKYTENLSEMLPVVRKIGPVALMEIVMRAGRGQPPGRPLGSHLRFSPWEKLMFNPVHLHRFPTPDDAPIRTAVTIGKRAKRPLRVSIPILIAAMSFGGALSKSAKIALARAASRAGTATNTGEAGLMEEERAEAKLLIGQYNRGGWLNSRDKYSRLDAIEIQLGQGAQGSAPQRTRAEHIVPEFREVFGLAEGEDAVIHSRLPGVDTKEQFAALVRRLQEETGVPVGLKIAATHHLERELEIALGSGVDFITVDGAEGGTHAAAPILEDDLGLPTMFAVSRARTFLDRKGARDVSLIAAGGLITPGDALKAMALGADAVYMGTAVLMALIGEQAVRVLPFEPPTSMVVYNAKATETLDVGKGADQVVRFLDAAMQEMELACRSLGRTSLSEVDRSDLCALDPFLAKALGVDLGWVSAADQDRFWRDQFPEPHREAPSWNTPAYGSGGEETYAH